ncbi:MAG: hypothetical protein LBB79_05125 [Prevotellaceae bacterium]|jgi:hypothetical protein|nr:hypothetical protein [Prevotellaceae bacterium]
METYQKNVQEYEDIIDAFDFKWEKGVDIGLLRFFFGCAIIGMSFEEIAKETNFTLKSCKTKIAPKETKPRQKSVLEHDDIVDALNFVREQSEKKWAELYKKGGVQLGIAIGKNRGSHLAYAQFVLNGALAGMSDRMIANLSKLGVKRVQAIKRLGIENILKYDKFIAALDFDWCQSEKRGITIGKKQGLEKAHAELTYNCIVARIPVEDIANLTNLTVKEVQNLRNQS